MKLVGKILNYLMCAAAVVIVVLVAVLTFLNKDGAISDLAWTEEMINEYESDPDGFRVEYIKVYNDNYFTEDGYFSVSAGRWIPSCQQWQFTVRYNKSTLAYLGKEKGLDLRQEEDHFTFALVDSDGNMYTDFEYKKEIDGRYTYYRLIFDDVSIKKIDNIEIMIYYIDDVKSADYSENAIGKLPLYYSELEKEYYDFEKELPDSLIPSEGFIPGSELLH